MKDRKYYGLYIRLTSEEEEIVKNLKKRYSINMSQYLRNQIIKLGEKLKDNVGKEL
jgi:predicted DNA-binding protein